MDFFTGSLDSAIHACIGHLPKRKWAFTLGHSYTGEVQLSASAMFNRQKNNVRIALWPEGAWDEARAVIAGSTLGSRNMDGSPVFTVKDYGPVSVCEAAAADVAAVDAA